MIIVDRSRADAHIARPSPCWWLGRRNGRREHERADLFGLCAAALVGFGLYGVITNPQPLRKILAFNLIGNGVFLLFGAIARRGAAAGFGGDPVPQGLLITGIVVAFSATALAVALVLRLFQATGSRHPALAIRRRKVGNRCPRCLMQIPCRLMT